MIETEASGQRRRHRRPAGRRVAADRDRGGPAEQPALPVQAADPAHGAGQPGTRTARRRAGGDQRGLPLGAGPARRAGPPRQRPRALPGPRRGRAQRGQALASPPAPSNTRSTTSTASSSSTARTHARSAPGSTTTATPARTSSAARTSWCSERDSDRATGASSPGSAASGRSRGWWSRSMAIGSPPCARGRPSRPRAPSGSTGSTLPGSRQRALARLSSRASRAHPGGRGRFWTWREQMYEVAARLDPESYFRLARATFAEMALAGVTAVGEFHYVHHDPGGARTRTPTSSAWRCWPPRRGRASASPCSTPATCTAASPSR